MAENENKRRARRPGKAYLASSSVTIPAAPATRLIQQDIFNEPTRERLDMGGNRWVRMFEQNDTFLKSLIACVNNSPTLRRIIADKTNMVTGDGFIPMQGRANALLTTSQAAPAQLSRARLNALEDYISRVNLHGQSLTEILAALAYDYDAFGNCFCEIITGPGVCYVYHVPVYMVGIRKAGADQIIRSVGIYDNWEEVPLNSDAAFYAAKGFREVPLYPEFSEAQDGLRRSVIHLKQYAPGYFYWGLPEWIGAKMWAELEYLIQRFNVSKLENNFVPAGVLQFFGQMSQTEAAAMLKAVEAKFAGTGNNNKVFMQVVRDEKLKAQWQPLAQQNEGEFMELQELAASAIVTANRWSKSLAGFATEGQLGTNQQIRQEMEYLQNTVIKQRQNLFLSRVINPYLELSAQGGLIAPGVQFTISNSLPVSFMGEVSVENNLTTDEKREVLGYGPMDVPIVEPTIVDNGATN
jgi:hypothetical protein